MSDLAGIVADANLVVEGSGAKPDRQPVVARVERLPEAHVVTLRCAFAGGLLEREVLLSAVIVERADWGALIGPIEQHAAGDAQART
jgi:hypothetical protein